ncbi:MAG: RsmD family RNA methyltransferase, partial [Chloroflexi bacterium]|nr:RsmD family RNA methyltransferase [Chloroflexota bacterium]
FIIMDPPYSNLSIGRLVAKLATSELLGTNSLVVVTYSYHHPLDSTYAPLYRVKERRHGDSCIALYKKGGKP